MLQHHNGYEFVIDMYQCRFKEVCDVIDSIAVKEMEECLDVYLKGPRDACYCDNLNCGVKNLQMTNKLLLMLFLDYSKN